jgi:hypothetical protein
MFALYEKIQVPSQYAGMQEAGDVWMLGFSLLTVYYELLAKWPYASGEEFYQNKNEAFHDLIEAMTRLNPEHRLTAAEVLQQWVPSASNAAVISENVAENAMISENAENVAENTANASNAAVTAETAAIAENAVSVSRRGRPYLTLQSHPAGRNKTRRNYRN